MPRKNTRNLSGSVFKLKKPTATGKKFKARKRYTDAAGKRCEMVKLCHTHSEARIAVGNMEALIKRELTDAETNKSSVREYTFSQIADYYRKEYIKPAVFSPSGRKLSGFKRDLKTVESVVRILEDYFGEMFLREISFEDLRSFKEIYENTPTRTGTLPAVSTVNEKMSVLRRILNVAIQKNWLDVNPFKRGDSLIDKAGEARRSRMLTFEEEERLLKACEPHTEQIEYQRSNRKNYKKDGEFEQIRAFHRVDRSMLIPLIICALDTAMRRGEIFNLEWRQIDFENKVIYLTEEAAADTKTGTAGILPLTKRLEKILRGKFNRNKQSEKVFQKFDFKRAFKSACQEAGIEDLHFHDFRAAAISRMLMSGISGDIVRKISRHTSDKIFLSHYTRIDENNARIVGTALDNLLEENLSEKKKAA